MDKWSTDLYNLLSDLMLVIDHGNNIVFTNQKLKEFVEQEKGKSIDQFSAEELMTYLTVSSLVSDGKANVKAISVLDTEESKVIWKILERGDHHVFVGELIDKQANLSEQHEFLQSIVDAIPGSIYWKDKNGVYLGCNQYMAQIITGGPVDTVIGKTDSELHGHGETPQLLEHDKMVMRTGLDYTTEEPVELLNGETKTFMAVKMPLRDRKDNVVGVIGNSVDISRLKELEKDLRLAKEKAEEANQIKSDFIANMSHDLRTPLNSLLGAAQILLQRDHFDTQEPFINTVFQSGNLLLRLVEDILSFSKIEAGNYELSFDVFNLPKVVDEVVVSLTHQADVKGIEIFVNYHGDLPDNIISSASAVRRILSNLLGNAIKFTESGRVDINIAMNDQAEKHAELVLEVRDTGFGIPEDKLQYIFERFARLDPVYRGRFEGLGLGLNIVKSMTSQLSGKVLVDSKVGKGSSFTVKIPVGFPGEQEIQSLLRAFFYAKPNILLVGQDRAFLATIAKHLPFSCTTASPEELEEVLHESRYHILLVDSACQKNMLELQPVIDSAEMLCVAVNNRNVTDAELNKFITENGFFSIINHPANQKNDFTITLKRTWDAWLVQQRQKRVKESHEIRVLLVENDIASQEIALAILEGFGCTIDAAVSGEEALDYFKKGLYDIVFMDIGLGDMSGFEIAQEMRKIEDGISKPVPIIALTAHVFEDYEGQSICSGMTGYMTKPVLQEDFDKILKEHIFKVPEQNHKINV